MGDNIAMTLALPVIWACTSLYNNNYSFVPETLCKRIINKFKIASGKDLLQDIVIQESIIVSVHGGQVNLISLGEAENENLNGVNNLSPDVFLTEIRALNSNVMNLKRRVEEIYSYLKSDVDTNYNQTKSSINRIYTSVSRISAQPLVRSTHQVLDDESGGINSTAVLAKGPKNLYDLWKEYRFGSGGRNPAKLFSAKERGRWKTTYCRRKIFWDTIDILVTLQ